ncbi:MULTISPECIES: hypothetical protein [Nonomuraea]|uniref:Uncharacterized protein n=2 Tax=Nonomuraea TaxID=83681 RepID=A0ABV5QDX2_9ACTN|nr:hypothetical protein [Nonomuraea dietziae]MBB3727883.1 putative TIM-barrel fold metal-dependent hydrolase [Nonomuraea dietziae]
MADRFNPGAALEPLRGTTAAARRRRLDRERLLDRLEPVTHRPQPDDQRLFEQSSIGRVLLLLVKVDQEQEYQLCRDVAERVLGHVPDPDADDLPM